MLNANMHGPEAAKDIDSPIFAMTLQFPASGENVTMYS